MNPLSRIYGAAGALRNSLFDHGILGVRRLERPVVSVGNLSVGGAGKTPFVIALGELLKARGVSFDVLSRGYGRKSRGVLVVDPEGRADSFGDESLLIARKLGVPVVVGESRYEAGRVAEERFPSQLHILDDGFQHRSLARDFDIVLLAESDADDRLLPAGRLREPLTALARADATVLPVDLPANSAFEANPALRGKLVWRTKRIMSLSAAPKSPVVFCGIARPGQFFAQVRAEGVLPVSEVEFRDHHAYNRRDIELLLKTHAKKGADGFLTTEKDAVNLGRLRSELNPLAVATLSVSFDNPADVLDTILRGIGV